MSEPRASRDDLTSRIAELVLDDPGVVRLEPSLRSRFRMGAGVDGVTVRLRDGIAVVGVEIATRASVSARVTAERVEQRIAELVVEAGYVCESVSVSVLAVERR